MISIVKMLLLLVSSSAMLSAYAAGMKPLNYSQSAISKDFRKGSAVVIVVHSNADMLEKVDLKTYFDHGELKQQLRNISRAQAKLGIENSKLEVTVDTFKN